MKRRSFLQVLTAGITAPAVASLDKKVFSPGIAKEVSESISQILLDAYGLSEKELVLEPTKGSLSSQIIYLDQCKNFHMNKTVQRDRMKIPMMEEVTLSLQLELLPGSNFEFSYRPLKELNLMGGGFSNIFNKPIKVITGETGGKLGLPDTLDCVLGSVSLSEGYGPPTEIQMQLLVL